MIFKLPILFISLITTRKIQILFIQFNSKVIQSEGLFICSRIVDVWQIPLCALEETNGKHFLFLKSSQ